MGQESKGFDMSRLTMGQKGILATGALLFIDLFLPWESFDLGEFGGLDLGGGSISGANGIGVLVLILAIALLVWEGIQVAGVNLNLNVSAALISAIVGGATVVFGVIRFLIALTREAFGLSYGAFIGIVLLLALAYASWVRFNESKTGAAAPPPAS